MIFYTFLVVSAIHKILAQVTLYSNKKKEKEMKQEDKLAVFNE